jgi:hypothetical protein
MNETQRGLAASTLGDQDCDRGLACLADPSVCRTEKFVDRDLELQRCLEPASCRYKRAYLGTFICGCPLKTGRLN